MSSLDRHSSNHKEVKILYSSSPVAKSVLDEFASRQRKQGATKLDQLLVRLSNVGRPASRAEVIEVLKKLEEFGYGKFIAGRKGHPTRFEWQYDLVGVGKAAAGGTQNVEEIQASVESEDDENLLGIPSNAIEHRYQLRPDWQIEITLPADFTLRESARLSDFIKTLPFDAESDTDTIWEHLNATPGIRLPANRNPSLERVQPIKLEGEGELASEQLIRDRR